MSDEINDACLIDGFASLLKHNELALFLSPGDVIALSQAHPDVNIANRVQLASSAIEKEGDVYRAQGFGYLIYENVTAKVLPLIELVQDNLMAVGHLRKTGEENKRPEWSFFEKEAARLQIQAPLDRDAYDSALAQEKNVFRLAMGHAPKARVPRHFEVHKDLIDGLDEEGQPVLKKYLTVKAGTQLSQAVPEVPGAQGKDVFHKIIQQPEDAAVPSLATGPGTEFRKTSGIHSKPEIAAAIDGNVVLEGRQLSVNDTLVIDGDINHTIGDLHVYGSLQVNGSICGGVTVSSSGTITVFEHIENAHVSAEGDLFVDKGVFHDEKSRIEVGNDFKCNHAENAHIRVGGNISISTEARFCNIESGGCIDMTAGNGTLIGGVARAAYWIRVNELGSEACPSTDVVIDSSLARFTQAQKKVDHYVGLLDRFNAILEDSTLNTQLKNMGDDEVEYKAMVDARSSCISYLMLAHERVSELMEEHEKLSQKQEVRIEGKCYRRTQIKIDGEIYKIESDFNKVRFFWNDEDKKIDMKAI